MLKNVTELSTKQFSRWKVCFGSVNDGQDKTNLNPYKADNSAIALVKVTLDH